MKKITCSIILLLLVFLIQQNLFADQRIYKLNQTIKSADFDYNWIKKIDQVEPPYPENGPYQIGDIKTIKGGFTIYKFICTYPGKSHEPDETKTFHDLLVLKTNKAKKILDAYHYTLDWQDSPSLALYKASSKNAVLKNKLPLSALRLKSIADNKNIPQNGIILLK